MSTTIHVGNLSFSLGEKDLEEYFSKYGKIVDSYIVRRGGRPRGYGFIEFSSTKEADNALAANGDEINGRIINIELAKGKIVKSNFQGGNNNYGNNEGYRNNNNYENNEGYRNNNNYGNNGGYRNNSYRNNGGYRNNNYDNNGGYRNNNYDNNGGYRNNNYDNNGGYRNNYNNGGYRNNFNGGPRTFNQGGRTFYTLRPNNNYGGPRRNYNNNSSGRYRKPEAEKEKSLSTVYVSNIPFSFDEKDLANLFSDYAVKTARVVFTRNGRSRGFGFVEFETEQDQLNAIKAKDETEVQGRKISVKVSFVEKSEQPTSQEQTTTN